MVFGVLALIKLVKWAVVWIIVLLVASIFVPGLRSFHGSLSLGQVIILVLYFLSVIADFAVDAGSF